MRRKRFILGKQKIQSLAVELAPLVIRAEVGCVIPALLEILIPRRPLLPVPSLLVCKFNRRQNRQPLDRQRNVRQVRNRAVPILKIESVEKLLRLLRADLPQRLLHRQRRPRVLRHGVGLNLRLHAKHGEHFGRRRFRRSLFDRCHGFCSRRPLRRAVSRATRACVGRC